MFSHSSLFRKAESALLEEKAEKLFGLTRLLDAQLVGDFGAILAARGMDGSEPREDQIRGLNQALTTVTDLVAESFPGVGVGYYSADLHAILTYGPSRELGSKVGISLEPDHIGYRAMESGREQVGVGSMVRGDIMNCVRPIIRGSRPIGFIWANETIEGIYRQLQKGMRKNFSDPNYEPVLGLAGLLIIAGTSLLTVQSLQRDLKGLRPALRESFTRALEKTGRYVRIFLNSLEIGLVVAEESGKIAFLNSGMEVICGIRAADYLGSDWRQLPRRLGLTGVEELYRRLDEEGGHHAVGASRLGQSDGEKVDVDVLVARVKDGESTLGAIFLFDDTLRARESEERLRRAEKLALVGELAASIAHEIRNPLTIVAGSIQLIPDRLWDEKFLTSFARIAGEELSRVDRTVQGLLNFARFSEPSFGKVDLNSVLELSMAFIGPYAQRDGVRLELQPDANLPDIEGDPEHLKRAFLNLLINSIQAMPGGGTVRVKTRYSSGSGFVTVVVSDEGVGIPLEHHSRVFDVFFTTKAGGTGLGLSQVHRIVDEHQGWVDFESTPGKGTTFTVTLPIALNMLQRSQEVEA